MTDVANAIYRRHRRGDALRGDGGRRVPGRGRPRDGPRSPARPSPSSPTATGSSTGSASDGTTSPARSPGRPSAPPTRSAWRRSSSRPAAGAPRASSRRTARRFRSWRSRPGSRPCAASTCSSGSAARSPRTGPGLTTLLDDCARLARETGVAQLRRPDRDHGRPARARSSARTCSRSTGFRRPAAPLGIGFAAVKVDAGTYQPTVDAAGAAAVAAEPDGYDGWFAFETQIDPFLGLRDRRRAHGDDRGRRPRSSSPSRATR